MEYLFQYPLAEDLIVDTHAHYDDARFESEREELLTALPGSGVRKAITCGCDGASSETARILSEQYDYLYFSAGVHPCNLESRTPLSEIERLARHPKCVAIGEIGLDYYWVSDNKEEQIEWFEKQILLAKELDLPVIVHDRDAHADTVAILKKHRPKGVVHSFSGSPEMAKELLAIGMYIGVGGVITFNNARRLPEVVEMLPEDRMVLETDAPYMAPVPYRGKTNHSGMIYLCAQKIAELRGTSAESVLRQTAKNAEELFGFSE